MRILQLCTKVPYPPKDGGAAVVYFFSKAFSDLDCKVDILAVNPPKHYTSPQSYNSIPENISIYPVEFDTTVRPGKALKNLFFSGMPYIVERFINADYKEALVHLLKENSYDVVQIEGIYLCTYIADIRKYSTAKIALRAHNIEYALWQDIAKNERIIYKRAYLRLQAKRLKCFEIDRFPELDGVTTLTTTDSRVISSCCKKAKTLVAPFGVEHVETESVKKVDLSVLYFIGALDWLPNIEAIQWFVLRIWPEIHRSYPEMRFHIAGRNPSSALVSQLSQRKGIVFHGEVPNAQEFAKPYTLMAVPLFSGSGIRVKIIEAMQQGKIVIASAKAVDGIPAEDRTHFFLAETESDYLNCILMLHNEPGLAERISENARNFVYQNFNLLNIASDMLKFYNEL